MSAFRRFRPAAALAAALLALSTLSGCASLYVGGAAVVSDGTEVKGRAGAIRIGAPPAS
jgi:hypothetical protein